MKARMRNAVACIVYRYATGIVNRERTSVQDNDGDFYYFNGVVDRTQINLNLEKANCDVYSLDLAPDLSRVTFKFQYSGGSSATITMYSGDKFANFRGEYAGDGYANFTGTYEPGMKRVVIYDDEISKQYRAYSLA